ncbi:MAG: sugar transferase [Desulfomonile tiedjei]|nr:sugar transferase [Desulfomonile tiedjei]
MALQEAASREPSVAMASTIPAGVAGGLLRRYRAPFVGVADTLLISGACFVAYLLRFHSPLVAELLPFKEAIPDPEAYAIISLIMTLAWTFLMWQEGMYRNSLRSMRLFSDELRVVLWAGVRALAVVMVSSFLFRKLLISRIFLVMGFGLALVMLLWLRILVGDLQRWLQSRNVLFERFALLGTSQPSLEILQRLGGVNPLAKITGFINLAPAVPSHNDRFGGLPILGDTNQLERIIKDQQITGLIFASNGYDYEANPELKEALVRTVNCCETQRMPFYMIPDALNVAVRRNEVGCCCGFPVIELRDASVHPLYGVAKRLIDVSIAIVGLAVGLPVWLGIAAAIKLESKGPVLYVQERVGRNGRVFRMLKFRTMVQDAASQLKDLVDFGSLAEPVFKIRNDPRVTRIGRFLRRTGLDEVPQLFNILMGDMSLVGPRPEQVELVERYDDWQRRRLKARPGITGYQQVMSRGDPSLARRIHYDLYYLKHQSVLLDLHIIWKTVLVVIRGDGIT